MKTPGIRWLDAKAGKEPESVQVSKLLQRVCGDNVWPVTKIQKFMQNSKHIPKVMVLDDQVIGCLLYTMCTDHITVNALAVAPEHQRKGYGTLLANHIKLVLSKCKHRHAVFMILHETDVDMQLFLKKMGFVWTQTLFKNTPNEAYIFKYESTYLDTEDLPLPVKPIEIDQSSYADMEFARKPAQ